jgi:hypothetical protein
MQDLPAGRHRQRFSERLPEPMSSSVTPLREGYALSRRSEVVSPELALVDPELAASARASLHEPHATTPVRKVEYVRAQVGDGGSRALTALSNAALAMEDEHRASTPAGRSWRVLIGVAAVTILSLLLFDVRVQVGKTPASAEAPPKSPAAAPAPPNRLPVVSAAKRVQAKGEHATRPRVRRFAWGPTQGASAYHVELFRHNVRIFAADTKQPQLAVPARWQMNGRQQKLSAGEYRWLVWPVVSGRRAPSATVQTTLTISR